MLESLNTGVFEYEKLKPEEMQKRGILGRLIGIMADTVNPTRNGRKYSNELWENVFNNPIMKERIENNCCFGELGHPTDREETDMSKIAICMDGVPKKDSDGKLQAVFNILDTPNGRILKTLCDYGCNIGISSRGSGDLITDFDGNESVDPDTYNCEGWDAVLIPAVKEARLKYVTESLEKKRYNKTLRDRLIEAIEKETEDNKKAMKDSLDSLGIDLDDESTNDESTSNALEENTINYKGIRILHNPEDDKYYCELDDESYTFNSEKNAKIWIDMNLKQGKIKESLTEEQVGRDETRKDDKNVDDVLNPNVPQIRKPEVEPEKDSEEDVDKEKEEEEKETKITVSFNESIDWTELNGTEQFAVDRIINAIDSGEVRPGDPEEFEYLVRSITNMYGDANEYLDADDPMYREEGSYGRVRDYLLNGSYYKDKIKEYFGLNESLTEDVDDIQAARVQLASLLDDWYEENIANELSSDVKEAGWDADLQDKFLDFRNYLLPDFTNIEEPEDEVDDIESDIDGLREMLEHNSRLEKQIVALQEKLSVSYAMEKKLNEEIDSYREKISKLSKVSKENKILTEKLDTVQGTVEKTEKNNKLNQSKIKSLNEKYDKIFAEKQSQDVELQSLKETYDMLNSNLTQTKEQYSKKFERQNKLLEKYQKITRKAIDKYINMQATNLGMKPTEIKNRLPEKFSFNDIDSICESLREYKLNVNALPFNTVHNQLNEGVNFRVNNLSPTLVPRNEADELTDYDLKLMEMYK